MDEPDLASNIVWHGTSLGRFDKMAESGFTSPAPGIYLTISFEAAVDYAMLRAWEDASSPVVLQVDMDVLGDAAMPRLIRQSEGPPIFDPSYRPPGMLVEDVHHSQLGSVPERQPGQWVFTGDWSSALVAARLVSADQGFSEALELLSRHSSPVRTL